MNICGIVCEYNPFHNGHLFHIEETRRRGADAVVCIMSGNFVQRADFAIMQKRARAGIAVLSGADLVIELPLPWSIASAERFAYGAVSILNSLGVISSLSFGTENDDITALSEIAGILATPDFGQKLCKQCETGVSYATARERALSSISPELSKLIASPNNILAIEYIKALKKLNSSIAPIAIPRGGAAHDSLTSCDNIASATLIRELIHNSGEFSSFVPKETLEIYEEEKRLGHAPVSIKTADISILSRLKTMNTEDFRNVCDVSEGLEYRLVDSVARSTSLNEAIENAKTKRYAHSRIRRIFLNAFLGVSYDLQLSEPPYARILAFNDTGREIIRKAKKTSQIPIITKTASVKEESEKAIKLLALERNADDIYSLFMKSPISQGSTFTDSPVYIKK